MYRVADYQQSVATPRAAGVTAVRELEIRHGPGAAFALEGGGQRCAIYQLARPEADQHFTGRFDP